MDTHLIALDPSQLATAQHSLIEFITNKLGQAKGELAEADRIFDSLQKAKMSVIPAQRIIRRARLKITFYEKVQAALQAGYYVLPPIPCQAFAVRTDHALPPKKSGQSNWQNSVSPRSLPIGHGEYRSDTAVREHVDTEQETRHDGKIYDVKVWANTDWREIEFPFLPVKPEIVAKTGEAIRQKIFDVLAISPEYRAADPMVIGQIKHWRQPTQYMNFFVAWWLDTDTL